MATVAVVGLGGMGSRIARRLLGSGHKLIVWNRDLAKAEPLMDLGATGASTPADAARRGDAVITMVTNGAALRDVTEGPDGVVEGLAPGTAVIQMSTVGPADVARLASLVPSDAELLDAPVLGSISEADAGTLNVFVGGEAAAVERWTPLLHSLGSVVPVGPIGAGTSAKLVANSTLFGVLGVLGEALALSDALGLSRSATFDVLAATPLSAQAGRRREFIEKNEFPVRFTLPLARKDADLILAAAVELDLRLARAARSWLADAERENADRDYSAVLATIVRLSNGRDRT